MTRKILFNILVIIFVLYGLILALDHFTYAVYDYTPSASEMETAKTDYLSKICSDRGGVNCSVINPDASIVCNDGTVDKSLLTIYALPQCQKTIENLAVQQSDFMAESGCFPPSEMTCINNLSYQNLFKHLSASRLSDSELGKNELAQCRKNITTYEEDGRDYQQCLADNGQPQFELSGRIVLPILKAVFCPLLYGNDSSYSFEADLCLCDEGYFLHNNQCTEADKICQEKYGANAYAQNGDCIKTTPAPNETLITPTPSKINFSSTPIVTKTPSLDHEMGPTTTPEDAYAQPVSSIDKVKPGIISSIFNSIVSGIKKMLKLF